MPTLALIHTAVVNVTTFQGLCGELTPELTTFHMLDESLLKNTIREGSMSHQTAKRVVGHVLSAADAGADAVLIPIQCEYFALEGVSELMRTLERVRAAWNPGLAVDGVVLTLYDERLSLAQQVVSEVHAFFGDAVFETVIPRNVRLAEAPSFGRTILEYDIRSRGAQAYLRLAEELLRRREHHEAVRVG